MPSGTSSFVVTHYAVSDLGVGVHVNHGDGGAKDDAVALGDFGDIDDLGMGQLAFDGLDAALGKALLFAGSMVFGIFF